MSKSWKKINEEKAIFWKTHIDQWTESRLSQIEYCRQNGLRPNRFTYWKIKFGKPNQPTGLVQVPVPTHFCQAGLKLNIGRELQVEIPDGFKKETLEQVLSVLKAVQ
ncbi:IS66 family insertion sequence element accessory protein TnpA [Desulfobacula toluolica]|uniref:Conserved uncharacterized protein n=1 Tax=Desulfobacula toluolica (strain DSM 7467 / Tol2) TaxID=651182 RepID=K0NIH3_DESTT|nr:hypothetical protein [Desulfobacula toluolica]CCK78787.1 conserved uncharacterized protein [Desulfobacula toluolica Tol2]CCK78818.1 conserved uncharaterized protein [Desulfobacula toluolica Tol2]CCK79134.1 uncharacterized protein TOL2_C09690 [Desulfobacula toluolica Tol2]CCK80022.1 conserved uncharacterized protein [Desulfobacula toluolica Tol2]CCK80030.1 conserved uncharacterized protein [Desulfobacula toluolica Tol2]